MATVRDEVGKKVRDAIERVLRERLGHQLFREAEVRAGTDHDGEPVLFIVAHFDLVPEPIDPAFTVGITVAVSDALDEIGETRFPHITYDLHDDQVFAKKTRKRA